MKRKHKKITKQINKDKITSIWFSDSDEES